MSVVAERGTDTRHRDAPRQGVHHPGTPRGPECDRGNPVDHAGQPRYTSGARPVYVRACPVGVRVLTEQGTSRAVGCSARGGVRRWPALLALAVAVFSVVLGFGLVADGMRTPVPEHTAVVVVEPGQTLWGLAERFAPESDTAAVVERIVELNGLPGPTIAAGTPLVVPSGPRDTVAGNP